MRFFTQSNNVILALLTLVVLGAALITWYVIRPDYQTESDAAVLFNAPADAPYTDLMGQPIDFTRAQGKPLVVNAWATWSPYAATELPALAQLKQQYGERIEIIAVNRKESTATIQAYLKTLPSTEGITFVSDSTDHFFNTVIGYAMPETLFYDGQGTLIEHVRGTLTPTEFNERITSLIETD